MRIVISLIIVVIALNAQPDTLWTRIYGGYNSDYVRCVQVTSNNGFIMTGATASYGAGDRDVWLIRADSLGDTLWTRTYGGSGLDCAEWVIPTNDGGYAITGNTWSFGAGAGDLWIIKTDSLGDSLWTKTYGGVANDGGFSISQTADSGFMIAGATESFGAGMTDVWLLRTDVAGDTVWTRTYGGPLHDGCRSAVLTFDGGFLLAAGTCSYGAGEGDLWLIKTDAGGDTLWTQLYGGTEYDVGNEIIETADRGYYLTGYTESFGAGNPLIPDVWVVKTDSLGDSLWTRTYGGVSHEAGYSGQQTLDKGYIITGVVYTQNGDIWIIKTDSIGNILWNKILGDSAADSGRSIRQTSDGGYIIACTTTNPGAGDYDIWLIRLESEASINEHRIPSTNQSILNVFPTVVSNELTVAYCLSKSSKIWLSIYNTLGCKIKDVKVGLLSPGYYKEIINIDNLPNGIYILSFTHDNRRTLQKFIVVRQRE